MRSLFIAAFLIHMVYADTISPNVERECPCKRTGLWLDVVVVIDTSSGMTSEGVTQVLADVATVFNEAPISQEIGQFSRVGIVTYSSKANTKFNLTTIKSNDELMENIWDVEADSDPVSNLNVGLSKAQEALKHGREGGSRNNVRPVIIIYASDFRAGDVNDAKQLADQIKAGGTDIIAVAFDQGGKVIALDGLVNIASPGFFFRNTMNDLASAIQHALCQSNCFCKKQWTQYGSLGVKYGECLRLGTIDSNWIAAKHACQKLAKGGHLTTEFDGSKHIFNTQMMKADSTATPPYLYHIGLSYKTLQHAYFWEQPRGKPNLQLSQTDYQVWNNGYPNATSTTTCVSSAQTSTGSKFGWQNVNCGLLSKRYICQVPSCDTENYCALESSDMTVENLDLTAESSDIATELLSL